MAGVGGVDLKFRIVEFGSSGVRPLNQVTRTEFRASSSTPCANAFFPELAAIFASTIKAVDDFLFPF